MKQSCLKDVQAKVNALRELRSQTQEELDALLASVLRPAGEAFEGSCEEK